MSKLYLYNYNNYYNRIFKRESNLAGYGTPVYTLENTNFRYADGVDTDHVINYTGNDGDYVIITDSNNNILHRWFVTDDNLTRGGQRKLTLKRDLKVDYFDLYRNQPMVLHRSWVNSESPFVYNPEGFSYNQIKKEEILLNDPTRIPWYVVYFAKNAAKKENITFTNSNSVYISDTVSTPIAESIYASGSTERFSNIRYIVNAQDSRYISGEYGHGTLKYNVKSGTNTAVISTRYALDNDYIWFQNEINSVQDQFAIVFRNQYNAINLLDTEHTNPSGTDAKIQKLMEMNGKYVKDSLNKIYYVSVGKTTDSIAEQYTLNNNVTDYMKGRINQTTLTREGDWGDEAFGISYDKETYVVTTTEYTQGTLQWTLDFANNQQSNDSTFNVIAFPAKTAWITTSQGDYYINDEIAQKFIASLLSEYGTEFIYDIQMLPYCPLQRAFDVYDDEYNAPFLFGDSHTGVLLDKEVYFYRPNPSPAEVGCLCFYYIKDTTFTFDINKSIQLDSYDTNTAINRKVNNECNVYRLVSPNYNGQFEFSVAKNNGIDKFNVDVTLRPYNPYIHVNPNFKNLYGLDFNDSRGLICNGDFSIPLIKDAWTTYELQNKNYQQIFNRQIENMDFTQGQERVQAGWNMVAGAVGGSAMGALAGSKFGTTGAVAGAAIGGITSLAGGIIDYNMLLDRQLEQKDFAIDNFKYQLGNIKALPYSITKVTPFTANNKMFPFVEKYTATDEEINILINKLEYTSFTVEAIGTIQEHIDARPLNTKKFVQGTLIRIDGINASAHEAMALSYELEKGVYI